MARVGCNRPGPAENLMRQEIDVGRLVDLTGNVYGRLIVVSRAENTTDGRRVRWLCQCRCGTLIKVRSDQLRAGETTSCGCFALEVKAATGRAKLQDLTGNTYGRLIVLNRVDDTHDGRPQWLCQCRCDVLTVVRGECLRNGNTQSCGCLAQESHLVTGRKTGKTTHGHTTGYQVTSEYKCWAHMKERCLNPGHPAFDYYGGRGIDIDPRWVDSFETFLADVGMKPSPELSIDRIDNNRGYWPDNVRWATWAEQVSNKRQRRSRK